MFVPLLREETVQEISAKATDETVPFKMLSLWEPPKVACRNQSNSHLMISQKAGDRNICTLSSNLHGKRK